MRGGTGRRALVALVGAAIAGILLAGCGTQSAGNPDRTQAGITPLPTNGKVDYQLGGGYPPPAGVTIVTRDSTDTPAKGLYNICYINGFQTQDYLKSWWLKNHRDLVLMRDGAPVSDPGWPGEMILDSSTAAKRTAIAQVQAKTMHLCASKGFKAVEFDNLDSYTRSHGMLTKAANIALATEFVAIAHHDGLAAGQKNTSELGKAGPDVIHFDFAVAEECYRYDECASYTKYYGRRVIDIEYTDDLRGTFAQDCAAKQTPRMTILRDRDLTTPKSKAYVYQSC